MSKAVKITLSNLSGGANTYYDMTDNLGNIIFTQVYGATLSSGITYSVVPGATSFTLTNYTQSTQVYTSNLVTGNQTYTGRLGLKFTAGSSFTVTQLGAFDSDQNGLTRTIQVGITRFSDGVTVVGPTSFSGSTDPLSGKYRIRNITPVILPAASYMIVAVGYGVGEPNGNHNIPSPAADFVIFNGAGLITSSDASYYDASTTFGQPNTLDPASNEFHAGTFTIKGI